MNEDISPRQTRILKYIIEEYIETAEPVGSVTLDKKFNLGVSPATLRNEMAQLLRNGYLKQPHTSAGRVPTPKALKYYVDNLMQAKDLSTTEEVKIKEKVWSKNNGFDKTLREATKELAERTKSLAVASNPSGDMYYSGTANILSMPEFFDITLTKNVLDFLDHFEYFQKIFSKGNEDDIQILLAEDLGHDSLEPCAIVFSKFGKGTQFEGVIGVFGPCRLNYPKLIPAVKYMGGLMNELAAQW